MGSSFTDSPGVAFLGAAAPRHVAAWARAAERAGLGSVWLIEDYFYPGAFALAGAAAAVTERVTVGIGVVNPYTRHPALLAMGLAALRESRGLGVQVTDEGIFEAQRALAREEGVFVEPSSAAALTAVMQLVARKAVDPEQTIVLVLTSSGLKDPGASRAWLPEVPAAGDDFDALLGVLRERYGLELHG
ncbi:MAG: hypothetical protein A3D33_18065 [Candidatus Rokubacteria bacterium RIFCSPHIGHO2_02_FULL_73_26]|nr:MAG: hypothetical protein A3D33_18065 [Candidatus Rokubacteria bacterium RIFCSPHIGHO2_02_FULL_73_26]